MARFLCVDDLLWGSLVFGRRLLWLDELTTNGLGGFGRRLLWLDGLTTNGRGRLNSKLLRADYWN